MRFGIIAEGTADQAVLQNIIYGIAGKEASIVFIRPDLRSDATERNSNPALQERTFGGWEYVKKDCLDLDEINRFFFIDEPSLLVIHLDTAECESKDEGITRPEKNRNENYATELRSIIIDLIIGWLNVNHSDKITQCAFAVCIEEMEAWLLTIHEPKNKNTITSSNPKAKLKRILEGLPENYSSYIAASKAFTKRRDLIEYAKRNESLLAFIQELDQLCNPEKPEQLLS